VEERKDKEENKKIRRGDEAARQNLFSTGQNYELVLNASLLLLPQTLCHHLVQVEVMSQC
jgi:hypothetical protein